MGSRVRMNLHLRKQRNQLKYQNMIRKLRFLGLFAPSPQAREKRPVATYRIKLIYQKIQNVPKVFPTPSDNWTNGG